MNKNTAEKWRSQDEYDYEDYCGRKNGKHQSKDNCEEFTVMTSRRKSEGEKHLLVVVRIVRMKPKRRRRRLRKKPQLCLKVGKIKKVKLNRDASVPTIKQEENKKMGTKNKICITQIRQLVTQMCTESKNDEASTQKVKEDNLKVVCEAKQQEERAQHLDHQRDNSWDEEEERNQEVFLKSELLEMEQCSEIHGRGRRKGRLRKNRNKNNKRRSKPNSSDKTENGE